LKRQRHIYVDPVRADLMARREVDVVMLGIVVASILMFVAIGSVIGPTVVKSLAGRALGPDRIILNAFLLNIAIVIFAWARFRQLREELLEREEGERRARIQAETDPLTGFLNRRSFSRTIDSLLAARTEQQAIAVMMIDLDNFKQVNDYNGHHVGDLLLLECAKRLTAVLPSGAAVGRIGGDEFATAFAFERSRPERVDRLAEELLAAICQASEINAVTIEVTASIGIVRSDLEGLAGVTSCDSRGLLQLADIGMYNAKREGRNGFSWFQAGMVDDMRLRNQLERGIREGISRGEFIPYYERQIDLQSGELTGFEMLARWDSPDFGIVAPDIFIPVAEEIGAIGELSESVIAQALEDAKRWHPMLTLAINISPVQLRDPWFAQKLLKMLVAASFPPHRLEIEIKESSLHNNLPQVRSLVASLKNQGVRISLDDFGTGYSSLAQLRTLPFDRIKIDRSFVTGVVDNTDSAAIVRAITMLGEELDLPITAEGIETDAVLERLREYGQISGQGYLYGYPQPAAVTLEWLDGIGLAVAERTSPGGGSSDARIEVESLLARRGHRKFPSERRRTAER